MKIIKKTVKVNGNEKVTFPYKDYECDSLPARLAAEFTTQGRFYRHFLNISREDAELAGWHPNDEDFSTECGGWNIFLEARGNIRKEVVEQEVDLNFDLLTELTAEKNTETETETETKTDW